MSAILLICTVLGCMIYALVRPFLRVLGVV